jgi:hypothetical protein
VMLSGESTAAAKMARGAQRARMMAVFMVRSLGFELKYGHL